MFRAATGDGARPDVRTGGRWTARQRLKNALIRGAIRGALALADRLPERWLLGAGRALGAVASLALRRARRLAENNIALALPEANARALARRAFVSAGENLACSLLLRRPATRALDWVEVDERSQATLDAALAEGRGAVFVSAHLGAFELLPAALAELGYRPAVVVRESYDPALDGVVDAHRIARGVQVIHRGCSRAAVRIVRALGAGKLVGFLPDLGGRMRTEPAQLVGRTADLPLGALSIARRAESPLLVGTLGPRPASDGQARYTLRVERMDESSQQSQLTHRVTAALSHAILALPEQWLWMGPKLR